MDATREISLPTDRVIARIEGAVGWLIFNNPARRNAMSQDMWEAVPLAFDAFEADPAVRVVVHMARLHGGSRRVLRICELRGIDSQGDYRLEPVFEFRQEAVRDGRAIGRFRATGEVPESLEKLGASGIELARERFAARWIEASGAEGARHAA